MATCSRAAIMSRLCGVLALRPKDLCLLVFRVLRDLPPRLSRKFQKDPPPTGTLVRNLAELPQDMLVDIFAQLQIPDLVRAGSVCSSWRYAYISLRTLGLYKLSQTPCLFYTSESAGEDVGCLYSLAENRTYKLTLPDPPIRSRFIIGSSNGWLVTADERSELHLVNPITGEQIGLPSVVTLPYVEPINGPFGVIHKYEFHSYPEWARDKAPSLHALDHLREALYYKAFMFPDPYTGSYIVVLIHIPFCRLSFARAGDDKWTCLPHQTHYRDCMYIDGMLYALTLTGEIDAYDLSGSVVTMKVILESVWQNVFEHMYITQVPGGDLLQVCRTVHIPDQVYEDSDAENSPDSDAENSPDSDAENSLRHLPHTVKFEVYKVDMETKEIVEIDSLPSHVLFLGYNNSICLSAQEHPKLKANHVYFTDDDVILWLKNSTRDIGVMNLGNSSSNEIVSQIRSNWPCPTWITLNLAKLN